MGERSAGNPPAAFEVAGAGNGVTVGSTRARTGKPGIQTRPEPYGPPRQPSTLPAKELGFEDASDLQRDYPNFFWSSVHPYIGAALRYLELTQVGRLWVANLYGPVFEAEHGLDGN